MYFGEENIELQNLHSDREENWKIYERKLSYNEICGIDLKCK